MRSPITKKVLGLGNTSSWDGKVKFRDSRQKAESKVVNKPAVRQIRGAKGKSKGKV